MIPNCADICKIPWNTRHKQGSCKEWICLERQVVSYIIGYSDHKSLSDLSQLLDLINRSCLSIRQHSVFYKSHKGIFLLCQVTCVRVIYAQSLFPPASIRMSVRQSSHPIQPAFLVQGISNLELLHRNTWKILTRKAASFVSPSRTPACPCIHWSVGQLVGWAISQSVGWICQSVSLCKYAYLPACLPCLLVVPKVPSYGCR